jgi:hypothetical protein
MQRLSWSSKCPHHGQCKNPPQWGNSWANWKLQCVPCHICYIFHRC